MKHRNIVILAVVAASWVGCGSTGRPKGPVSATSGIARADVDRALQADDYCRDEGPERRTENYSRCDRPGLDTTASWVVVDFDRNDTVHRLRRYEHHMDIDAAKRRWHDLVTMRSERHGTERPEAREKLSALGEIPDGAVTWSAWLIEGGDKIAAVILMEPESPDEPNVLEVIRSTHEQQ